MLDIQVGPDGKVRLGGRLDAAQVEKARSVLDRLSGSVEVDCAGLEYISSAGISVLLVTLKRLRDTGGGLRLTGLNDRVLNVLRYAGLDGIFEIR